MKIRCHAFSGLLSRLLFQPTDRSPLFLVSKRCAFHTSVILGCFYTLVGASVPAMADVALSGTITLEGVPQPPLSGHPLAIPVGPVTFQFQSVATGAIVDTEVVSLAPNGSYSFNHLPLTPGYYNISVRDFR